MKLSLNKQIEILQLVDLSIILKDKLENEYKSNPSPSAEESAKFMSMAFYLDGFITGVQDVVKHLIGDLPTALISKNLRSRIQKFMEETSETK